MHLSSKEYSSDLAMFHIRTTISSNIFILGNDNHLVFISYDMVQSRLVIPTIVIPNYFNFVVDRRKKEIKKEQWIPFGSSYI